MTDHDALASDLALRLGACTLEELRTFDLVMRDLEHSRGRTAASLRAESDEAHEWDQDAHLTRVSTEPARIALSDIDDRAPYEAFDVSDVVGGCEDG